MNPISVLYDHQIYMAQKFGGISRYFNELMKIDPALVTVKRVDPEKVRAVIPKSIITKGIRYAARPVGLQLFNESKATAAVVKREIENTAFDILHPTYYASDFLAYSQKPFVVTVHDMIHEIYSEYPILNDGNSHGKRILCEKASHIIAISEKTKADLIDIFNVPEEKITTIYHASSFSKEGATRPAGLADIGKYILFTGQRVIYKNFHFPLLALAEILKSDPQISLLCSGPAFTASELQRFRELKIEKQVHHIYLQTDAELAWAYSNAALFIFPSLYEGFGFPILEAFACHCPVISSTGGSLPEVAGDAALYFDPKSFREILQAATEVLYQPTVKEDLIQKGTKQLARFSWDKCRNETYAVYQKVLASSRGKVS